VARACPFFSILRFLDFAHGLRGGRLAPADEARLREAYLVHWQDYGSMEQLQEAFVLAQPIHCWHQALRWYHELAYVEATSSWGRELLEATIGLLRDRVKQYEHPEMTD
jgi:hypothetical protein